jgi:hypothetical protein
VFGETAETIDEKIEVFTLMDAKVCKLLTGACLLMDDEAAAVGLLRRLRNHISITDNEDRMYEVDYYLDYVKDLVEIVEDLQGTKPVRRMRADVKDIYETFLYNRLLLQNVLYLKKKESDLDEMRSNYYLN